MSASVNKVILIGNVGADPEVAALPSGKTKAEVRMATSFGTGDSEVTEWHRIVFWEKLADIVATYVTKGSKIYVEGRIQTRNYDDKDGVKKYITEVVAERMQMLSSKPAAVEPPPAPSKPKTRSFKKPSHTPSQADLTDLEF